MYFYYIYHQQSNNIIIIGESYIIDYIGLTSVLVILSGLLCCVIVESGWLDRGKLQ